MKRRSAERSPIPKFLNGCFPRAAARCSGDEDRCTIYTVQPASCADDLQTDKPEITFGPYLPSDSDRLAYQFRGQTGRNSLRRQSCAGFGILQAGRLHHKSLSEQHLLQVGVVPTGGEAFVLHADLQRVIVLQKAQRRATEDAEVGVGVAKTNA